MIHIDNIKVGEKYWRATPLPWARDEQYKVAEVVVTGIIHRSWPSGNTDVIVQSEWYWEGDFVAGFGDQPDRHGFVALEEKKACLKPKKESCRRCGASRTAFQT